MKRRRQLRVMAVLGAAPLVLVAVVGAPASASADAAPAVTVSPSFGPPAGSTTITGSGFCPGGKVVLRFAGKAVGQAAAGGAGQFSAKVAVPAGALPGTTATRAAEAGCGAASTPFLVRSNVRQVGSTPIENYLSPANVGRLAAAWSAPRYRVLGAASVVKGIAYYGAYNGDESGATFYAADARTGVSKWAISAGPVVGQPAVVGGTVYFGTRSGGVSAVDAATGALRWSADTAGPVDSPVQVVHGTVYVPVDNATETHGVARLLALDAGTGVVRWEYDASLYFSGAPQIVDGVVYFSSADGYVHAVDAATGALVWTFRSDADLNGSATVYRGVVYAGSDAGTLYALDAATGVQRWTVSTGVDSVPDVKIGNDLVYVHLADGLHALDRRTGADQGLVPVATGTGINGVIYELDGDSLVARDDTTGSVLSSTPLPGDGDSITVVNGAVYVGTETGLSVYTVNGALPRA